MTRNKLIDYSLDKMPNGDFVGECYMLTHDIINAIGNYATQKDMNERNKQFIKAETLIRDYVWKSCQRAAKDTLSNPDVAEMMADTPTPPNAALDDGLRTLDWERDITMLKAQMRGDEIAIQRLDRLGKLIAALRNTETKG